MALTSAASSSQNRPLGTKLDEIGDLQGGLKEILFSTSWPKDAVPEAKRFAQWLDTCIDVEAIPGDEFAMSEPLRNVVGSVIGALDDACKKLKVESANYQDSRKSLWKSIKQISHKGECKDVLRDCRKALEASLEALKTELLKMDNTSGSNSVSITIHRGPPNQPYKSPADNDSAWREIILGPTKTIFKTVSALSGAIPVAGSYIGGVATFGLTCIQMVEGMDQNNETVKSLGIHINALSRTLEKIRTPSRGEQEQIMQAVNELHANLEVVRSEIQRLQSGTTMHRFWTAEKNAGTLKQLQDQVRTALEEIQLLTSTNTSLLVNELLDTTRGIENRNLLRSLGDGKSGLVGNLDKEVRCFPGTRVEVLERIDNWMRSREPSDRVLWIHGMAGRGKSTIASTVEATWRQRAVCALFHFRRGQNSLDTRLICSLAKQLSRGVDSGLRDRILASVRKNEDIVDARLNVQFKELLVDTLAEVNDKPYPVLIVIDALDECDTPNYAVDFIKLIKIHLNDFPENVKILLTSRPELPLLRELRPSKWITEDLESDQEEVERDIERYLQHDLVEIRMSQSLPMTWPSEEVVLQLAQMSQGLFQWARTLTMFIRKGNAISRLEDILESPGEWKGVDELYRQILSKAIENLEESRIKSKLFLPVLGTILAAAQPISLDQIAFLHADVLGVGKRSPQDAPRLLREEVLADLNSLLSIPSTSTEPVLLMHTSIRDLLLDRGRCKNATYWVNLPVVHQRLATTCLYQMNQHLRKNIADLHDISQAISEVRNIAQQAVPAGLLYCCRSWSVHLADGWTGDNLSGGGSEQLVNALKTLSETKALFWLEVMSLVGWLKEAVAVAKQVAVWFSLRTNQVSDGSVWGILWSDMHRFITAFWEPIAFNPMQIYVSGLAHCPQRTVLWEKYQELAEVISLSAPSSPGWPSQQWARSVGCTVCAVSYSPDGSTIATGCWDGVIRLWDTQSGAQMGEPLRGSDGSVCSVTFSADGRLLASGDGEGAIRLWDTQTWTPVGKPWTGHEGWVHSVSFSPDGNMVASGADDQTVRLWDTQTGVRVGEPLSGHTKIVMSVSFSPNGNLVASASWDKTIRLWDTQTRALVGEPLTGHTTGVTSVSFSSDGKLLVSGSWDDTVRLWNTQTGAQVGEPLARLTRAVACIGVSPDGELVASGSDDGTVLLWNVRTRAQVGEPMKGHAGTVKSVSFSPDGKLVASGSSDGTVRQWETQTRTQPGEPSTGHADPVTSTSLSSDGKLVVSGSIDGTVRLWDTRIGKQVGEPLIVQPSVVSSVVFSSDGKLVAFGCLDMTIRLWDTQSRTQVGEPLKDDTPRYSYDSIESVTFSPHGDVITVFYDFGPECSWNVNSQQKVDRPPHLLSSNEFLLRDRWFRVGSSRVFWFPSQYWTGYAHFHRASGVLVARYGSTVAFFNILRLLDASVLPQSS